MNLAFILFLPLAGYLVISIMDRYIKKPNAGILASSLVGISFILGIIQFFSNDVSNTTLFAWITAAGINISFGLQSDHLTLMMILLVTGVSTLIHIYSIGYMHHDENFNRFFAYLNLFVFFMLLLVMANNYVLLFAGWEGVGLCSYLLIGFWFKNPDYAKAANKAFIMNRIGDLGFLLGIFTLFFTFKSLTFSEIQAQLQQGIGTHQATMIALFLFIGAVGKSAQIPLFTWLPDAMAGPTPVSALIHAATMVTAGIYLVIRSKAIFILSPFAMYIVAITGIVTAIFAATIALKQNDIKKILAYSTVSQLGLMFSALGMGAFDAAFFHLITHAFFKALLFLGAGSVIHALSGEQDIRKMGGLRSKIKTTTLTMLIGALAISGIPPFSGFFSKDSILAAAMNINPIFWIMILGVSLLTAFYMFRLIYVVFFGSYRGNDSEAEHIHESPTVMTYPLVILAILSVIGGFLNIPALFGGNQWLSHFIGAIQPHSESNILLEYGSVLFTIALIAMVIYYSYYIYIKKRVIPENDDKLSGYQKVLARKYYIDEIYDTIFVKPFAWISTKFYSFIEFKIIDASVEGVGKSVEFLSRNIRYLQSGSVNYYLLFMVLGIIVVLVFNLFF